jgi:hypothetical protein
VRGAKTVDDALAALDRDVDVMLEKRRWMLDHGRLTSDVALLTVGPSSR